MRTIRHDELELDPTVRPSQPVLHQFRAMVLGRVRMDVNKAQAPDVTPIATTP